MTRGESGFVPSRLKLGGDAVTVLRHATEEWIDSRKLASLDEWVSIPITVLPFIILVISSMVPTRASFLSVVAGGLSVLFWGGYKVAKAKQAIDLRFFVITSFLQGLITFVTNIALLSLILVPGIETSLSFPYDIILKLGGVLVSIFIVAASVKQWGIGPCRIAEKCWNLVVRNIQPLASDSWNHMEGIRDQVALAACRLCGAMMRPGMAIALVLELSFLVGWFGNPTPTDLWVILAMFLILTPFVSTLAYSHVKAARAELLKDLEAIDKHLELLHDILEIG